MARLPETPWVRPSSILRALDGGTREVEMGLFSQDLRKVAALLED